MADEKKLYMVQSSLHHDKHYEKGDTVHLTEQEAEPLLKAKVVESHVTEEPAADDKPLSELSKSELLEIAGKLNLSFPGNASKDTIAAGIAEARAKEA